MHKSGRVSLEDTYPGVRQTEGERRAAVKQVSGRGATIRAKGDTSSLSREPGQASPALSILFSGPFEAKAGIKKGAG